GSTTKVTARHREPYRSGSSILLIASHGIFSLPARHSRKTILASNSSLLCVPDARSSRVVEASSARKGKRTVAGHSLTHPLGWLSTRTSTASPLSGPFRSLAAVAINRSTATFPLL